MIRVLKYISLLIAAVCILFPPYIVIVAAFKSPTEFALSDAYALPSSFLNFDNFILVLQKGRFLLSYFNISYIIILSLVGNIILGTMVAYALGRFQFRFRALILGAYSGALIIPGITTQVATFGIIKNLGLFNTHYSIILLSLGADVIQIYIYLQFIKNIPYELDESAYLEGASLFRIYRSIIVPLLTPATATVLILRTISIYNDLYSPYLYMPSQKLGVVTTELMRFSNSYGSSWTLQSAAIILVAIPMIIFYLVLQKYIFSGIVNGAVK